MVLKKIGFIVVAILFFFSCKKDKDNEKPVIVVTSPTHLQNFQGIDTLIVAGTITDNRNVETVRISLRNDNNINVLSTVIKNPNVANYNLSALYFFDDIHLASGAYYFDISAYDGENTTHKFIDVTVNAVPTTRDGIFIIDAQSNTTNITKMDNQFNATPFQTVTSDYIGSAVNSYDQQLIISGSVYGGVTGLDTKNANTLWNIPTVNSPPTPFFTGMFYDNRAAYIGYYDGRIRAYNRYGASQLGAQAFTGYYCENGLVHDDLFFTEQHQISNNNNVILYVHWLASGVVRQQLTINEDLLGMYSRTTDEVILFSNDATNNGRLENYTISGNVKGVPFNIGAGKIDACEEISAGVYLIARNGDIILINANSFSTLLYLTGVNANLIKYDGFTNELFVVSGNNLTVYDYSAKTVKASYVHSAPIAGLEFLYNK